MDKQTAKNNLKELRDSLSKILDGKTYQDSEEIKKQSQEAIQQARSAGKQIKKSLLERIKDLPVVQKVSELGTAGSVAVSTAAVAQTTVAVDQTEIFVANVANDVVEERFEVPGFIDTFVDFHDLNDWGQVILTEKVSEAQAFVAEASEQIQTSTQSSDQQDSKSESSASSQDASSDKPSQTSSADKSPESEKTQKQETKGESSSKSTKSEKEQEELKEYQSSEENKEVKNNDSQNKGKQELVQEQETENKTETQQTSSTDSGEKSENVKSDFPIVETPFEQMSDDIKPHQDSRPISPTL